MRLEDGQTMSSRRVSRAKPQNRPSWTDLIDNRSGPSSIGPTRGTADEDYDFDDDDMSDLWPPAPEPALGRGDSRRDDDIVQRDGT